MTMANLSGRLAALIATIVVLAVLLLGWFMLLAPQRSKVRSLDNQIGETRDQIAATQAYVDSPATKKTVAQLARLKAMVPDDVRSSQVLRQLAAAAAASGVRVDSITQGTPTAIGSAQAVPFQLTVEGHYFGLGSFLHLLRSQARVDGSKVVGDGRLYSVSNIQFTNGSTSTGARSGVITATLGLNAFVNGAPAVAGTSATTTTGSTPATATTPAP
jgi:type IV pilus assembly PilO-like protein